MSDQSRISPTVPDMPPVYSRSSIALTGSESHRGSGHVKVLNDVSNNWSPHSAPGVLLYDRVSSEFWRKTIAIVMMPFVLTGAPVLSAIISLNVDQINSTPQWLRYIFSKPKLIPLNVLAIVIAIVLNIWLLFLFGDLLFKLYVLGEVPNYLIITIYDMVELVPILLAVDLFWIKGYLLRDVIYKLDTLSMNSEKPNSMPVVVKLIVVYVICFSHHIINYLTYQWRLKFGYSGQSPADYFKHLPFRVVNTFLIPVYFTFLCAIQMRFRRMNEYIKRLIVNSERPHSTHLREIKTEFKNNGLIIGRINATFNIVISAFFGVILLGMAVDALSLFYSILAYMAFSKAASEDPATITTTTTTSTNDILHLRELVRCISADVLVLVMKSSLIGLTVLQMMAVNHQSRAAPIHLSDFFSQFQHLMQTDLYHSFRLLHNYMRSRLENTDRPSLVKNALLSNLPVIKNLLSTKL